MDLSFIKAEDWREFYEEHYTAYMFLLRKSLEGETRYLEKLPSRNDWQEKRLAELSKRH